jgi:hypothetical protein
MGFQDIGIRLVVNITDLIMDAMQGSVYPKQRFYHRTVPYTYRRRFYIGIQKKFRYMRYSLGAAGVKPYIDEVLLLYLYKHARKNNLLTLI